MTEESDPRIKAIWELHLNQEIGQLRLACEMMRRYEGVEAEEILPRAVPEPTRFQENKKYVRDVLASQIDLRTYGTQFIPLDQLPKDAPYFLYQQQVNSGGMVPSETIIDEHVSAQGSDYRHQTEGPHPIKQLQQTATQKR
jgi:hypothetical protein